MPFAKRGYPDFDPRISPGWRVVLSDSWPINTTIGPDDDSPNLDTWRFETYGDVTNPLSLTYEEFLKLPHVTILADHHCIDGWSYLGHKWGGVPLHEITKRTMPIDSARHILVECEGGVSQTFPIDQDLLLATERNGRPLTRGGGFPPIPPEENPWNCNDLERKKPLKKFFSRMVEEERKRRMERWAIVHGKSK